jgi:hypothetical protein
MKYLLPLILLFLMGCDTETGGKYTGRIVEMTYNVYDRKTNTIDVLTGTDTKRIHDSPYFENLIVGDRVVVECTAGFFAKCYITHKVKADE